jgi:hypothetical protein
MSERQRSMLWFAIAAIVIGGMVLLWNNLFEKAWSPVPWQSQAAQDNPMLAATLLLKQHHIESRQIATLEQALSPGLAAGNMLISNTDGEIDDKQADELLKWVKAGNTLILQPIWSGKLDIVHSKKEGECGPMLITSVYDKSNKYKADENKADADAPASDADAASGAGSSPASSPKPEEQDDKSEKIRRKAERMLSQRVKSVTSGKPDPISRKLLVELRRIEYQPHDKHEGKRDGSDGIDYSNDSNDSNDSIILRDSPCIAKLRWPGTAYDLQIDTRYGWLRGLRGSSAAKISDQNAEAIRVVAEGRGHIVLMGENYFDNYMLARYDHAQLLLHLLDLHAPAAKNSPQKLIIVQHLSNRQWYEKLWDHFPQMLITLALLLLLLLWLAIRRFGSVLPLPEAERRALLEHVDASGRWLWQADKGAQIMLEAMRKLVDKTLTRRVPQLSRMAREEQLEFLVQACAMNRLALDLALFKPAATNPQQFIRQINTLQRLRKHYER